MVESASPQAELTALTRGSLGQRNMNINYRMRPESSSSSLMSDRRSAWKPNPISALATSKQRAIESFGDGTGFFENQPSHAANLRTTLIGPLQVQVHPMERDLGGNPPKRLILNIHPSRQTIAVAGNPMGVLSKGSPPCKSSAHIPRYGWVT